MRPIRVTPPALVEGYQRAIRTPSDINEHLDLLWKLAMECEHVTEFGMRGANGSTLAFLAAQPTELISWDLNPWSVVSQQVADLLLMRGHTQFQPRVGDTLKIEIEPTDLLFIDTLHTGEQLFAELVKHADPALNRVKKYLAFHDTATFGMVGEDGREPGLRGAIREFQRNVAFPLWELIEDRDNNNGLVVLRRVDYNGGDK